MRRQVSGRIIALAFIASFSRYSEAFHAAPSFFNRPSRHYDRSCALNKDDGYLSLMYVSDTSWMGGSSGVERRKAALTGNAPYGFRVFGTQAEEGGVQKDDIGYSAEARSGLDEKTLEVFVTDPVDHSSACILLLHARYLVLVVQISLPLIQAWVMIHATGTATWWRLTVNDYINMILIDISITDVNRASFSNSIWFFHTKLYIKLYPSGTTQSYVYVLYPKRYKRARILSREPSPSNTTAQGSDHLSSSFFLFSTSRSYGQGQRSIS